MIDIAALRKAAEAGASPTTIVDMYAKMVALVRPIHEKDLSGPCAVYLLWNPKKRCPFYVGITKYPRERFLQHTTDPASAARLILVSFLEAGYHASLLFKIYKICPDRNTALALERKLIITTPGLVNREHGRFRVFDGGRQ